MSRRGGLWFTGVHRGHRRDDRFAGSAGGGSDQRKAVADERWTSRPFHGLAVSLRWSRARRCRASRRGVSPDRSGWAPVSSLAPRRRPLRGCDLQRSSLAPGHSAAVRSARAGRGDHPVLPRQSRHLGHRRRAAGRPETGFWPPASMACWWRRNSPSRRSIPAPVASTSRGFFATYMHGGGGSSGRGVRPPLQCRRDRRPAGRHRRL